MKKYGLILIVLLVAALAIPASAGVVVVDGLVNTGVGIGVGQEDLNWTLAGPEGVETPYRVKRADRHWVAEPGDANWIGPDLSVQGGGAPQKGYANDPVGEYTYLLTFDVNAAWVPYLQITGKFATDNNSSMWLNDHQVATTGYADFGAFNDFVISDYFEIGVNTLKIVVTNGTPSGTDTNPSGLIVAGLTATVPEPLSVAVWSFLCMVGVGVALWRRRK